MKFFVQKPILFVVLFFVFSACQPEYPPSGFKVLQEEIPTLKIDARYFSANNFIGKKVDGYQGEKLVLTSEAAQALKKVQAHLASKNIGLKVFDTYRPQRAVDHFVRWCADENDTITKAKYYPNLQKNQLIPGNYIAEKSGHSRGSTVDLTLVNLTTGKELDMGTPWDYFGPESHGDFDGISAQQKANRKLLADVMSKHGFVPLPEEWWHFTLKNEPFPDTYFNFVVE